MKERSRIKSSSIRSATLNLPFSEQKSAILTVILNISKVENDWHHSRIWVYNHGKYQENLSISFRGMVPDRQVDGETESFSDRQTDRHTEEQRDMKGLAQ